MLSVMLATVFRKLTTLIEYQDAVRQLALAVHTSSRTAGHYKRPPQKHASQTETDHLSPVRPRPEPKPTGRQRDREAPQKINRQLYNLGFEGDSVLENKPSSNTHIGPDMEFIYGIHPVKLALTSGRRRPTKAYFKKNTHHNRIQELRALCREQGVPTVDVSNWQMDRMAFNLQHQGVLLKATKLTFERFDEDCINRQVMYDAAGHPAVWLLPYMVKDAHNTGAVLRSAYYFGVDKVLVPEKHSAAANAVVSKASSGALEVMSIETLQSDTHIIACLQRWQKEGGRVVGTTADTGADGATPVGGYLPQQPTLVIMGSEMSGIPDTIMEHCDVHVYIDSPSLTKSELVDSLNVSVATGIILHSILGRREVAKLKTSTGDGVEGPRTMQHSFL